MQFIQDILEIQFAFLPDYTIQYCQNNSLKYGERAQIHDDEYWIWLDSNINFRERERVAGCVGLLIKAEQSQVILD